MKKKKLLSVLASIAMVFSLMAFPMKVNATGVVASIGDKTYETLLAATQEVQKGETILLLENVEIANDAQLKLTGDKYDFTLDLNGHKISQEKNGTVGKTNTPIQLYNGAKLTVKDSGSGGEIFGYQTPILVLTNSTLTLESGTLKGEWYGLSGNGNYHGTVINIKGGTIVNEDPDKTGSAIYHPQNGKLNISGGLIKGDLGIQLCSGNATILEMSGGRIEGTGEDQRVSKTNGDGAIPDGAAISIVNREGYDSEPKVNITGGEFASAHSTAVLAYMWAKNSEGKYAATDWAAAKDNVIIKGGSFSTTPEAYVASTYKTYQVGNMFNVAPVTTNLELSAATLNVEKGNTAQLTTTLTPTTTLDKVEYTSSDESIASVDNTGKVTANKVGTATITATAGDKSATCTVTVYKVETPDITIPTTPTTGNEQATVAVDKASVAVITDSIKDVVANVETTTSISTATKEALKEAISAGKTISVKPEVKAISESKVDKETLTKIAEKLGTKEEVAQYFELSMMLTADGSPLGTLNELTGKVSFTVTIDKSLIKEGRAFYMIRVHEDGSVEKIEGTLKGDQFTFETDKFSTFALVHDDTKVVPTKKVDTGDTTNTAALVSLMGLSILAIGAISLRKKFNKK